MLLKINSVILVLVVEEESERDTNLGSVETAADVGKGGTDAPTELVGLSAHISLNGLSGVSWRLVD